MFDLPSPSRLHLHPIRPALRALLAFAVILLAHSTISLALAAQTVIVTRNVNLLRDPSTNQPAVRLLRPPEELELRDTEKTNNYYFVYRAESDEEGFVWANNVRVVTDPFVVAPAAPGLASTIDPDWPKAPPAAGRFRSPVRNRTCGPVGDGGDTATNRLRNRTDIPVGYHAVTFDAIGDLGYPDTRATSRLRWPAESLAVMLRFEGVPAQVVGYLAAIKPQDGGSGESANCHMTEPEEVDWHVALVEQVGQGKEGAIAVEPTPRIIVNHRKWTEQRLGPWLDSSDPVRISGWLLFDPSHGTTWAASGRRSGRSIRSPRSRSSATTPGWTSTTCHRSRDECAPI